MPTLLQDLRLSLRALVRQPLFTAMAVASLALGIGASTVIFSVVYALLLRPLPYPRSGELVQLSMSNPASAETDGPAWITPEAFRHLRHDPDSGLSLVGGFTYDYASLVGVPSPAQVTAGSVTADYFRVFGVPAALGRYFDEGDCQENSAPTVILSDSLWRAQFHADGNVVGKVVAMGDGPHTIIGVMGPGFKDTVTGCELWLPVSEHGVAMASDSQRRFLTTARLADNRSAGRETVRAFLATLSGRLAQADPTHFKGWHLESHPLVGGLLVGPLAERALWLLLGAVGCVLLVTCVNVANLQLVRAAARRRETGVRLALGASRARIMRGAFTESLVLAAFGEGLGVLAAAWGVDAVAALLPQGYSPVQDGVALNWPVLGFAVAAAVVAGLLTGTLPAWSAARQDPVGSLAASAGRGASEGPGGTRVRAVLVVAEIALALVLLAGAGLMGRSLLASLRTNVGVRLDRTLVVNFLLPEKPYAERGPRAEFYRRLLEEVGALPGVEGVGLTDTAMFNWSSGFDFLRPGQSADDPATRTQNVAEDSVNPGLFATLGIPLRRGRLLSDRDTADAPRVMVVNEAFAAKYFPTEEALGKRLTVVGKTPTEYEIVGVVGDVRRHGLDQDAPPAAYFCYLQRPSYYATLNVRAGAGNSPESLTQPVQRAIWRVRPDLPLGKITTLERAAAGSVAYGRMYTVLFASFAALTLGLAALGIYGTIAYSVGLRTREIGIRMALGAQSRDVLRLVLGQGVRLVAAGLVLGLGMALGLARLMTSLLYGIKPTDPATLAAVAALLGGMSLLACWLPARKAARIDPLRALREE